MWRDGGAEASRARPAGPAVTTIEGLEGNLCRCTGYHDIVEAASAGDGALVHEELGTGFGRKLNVYAEEALVGWLARETGRPEATFVIERVMEMIADETGEDPLEVR